ncbi:MAG: CinA family protein [Methylomonas sp.]|jgi:nicotinamide-nucleotide amidase|uniref:CinA family protein n=1 Tax=Methylomonas sp. TaxID=418 RepID=UPI0025E7052F|nr:CinA family protein [Methylomonas sp.]MCK9606690.1 CinA family protein [Methylomonas sp.]
MDRALYESAVLLGSRLQKRAWQLALAESCTGGGIAKTITDVPGSSVWFDRGFVSYSNAAKVDMLGVSQATLNAKGAVSEETALEMVEGALANSLADLAMAVTGIAGPDGGTGEKPVGTVFIAWQVRGQPSHCVKQQFSGDRLAVRRQVVLFCLQQAYRLVGAEK